MANNVIVKKRKPILVCPARKTETGFYFLSNLDQNIAVMVRTIYVFKSPKKFNDDAVEVIKYSLAEALFHYHPVAGRLKITKEGKLGIDCSGEGAVFVEADAECDASELGDLRNPDLEKHGNLVYDVPGTSDLLQTPPLIVQVTRFMCGGFALGLCMSHCMFDGKSAIEFVSFWCDVAKGNPNRVSPFLDRAILKARDPPRVEHNHREFDEFKDISNTGKLYEEEELLHESFCFTPQLQRKLKDAATEDGAIQRCTTFEALTAFVWRTRCLALKLIPQQQTKLLFAVDGRAKFDPPLPEKYAGNGIVLTCASCSVEDLVGGRFSFVVGLVQEAIARVQDGFMRSAIDYFEVTRARPSLTGTLLVTNWHRLSFESVDFGWGPPLLCGPASLPEKEVILFLTDEREKGSVSVLLGLPSSSMVIFKGIYDMLIVENEV